MTLVAVSLPIHVDLRYMPGANRSTDFPQLAKKTLVRVADVADTVKALSADAGETVLALSLDYLPR